MISLQRRVIDQHMRTLLHSLRQLEYDELTEYDTDLMFLLAFPDKGTRERILKQKDDAHEC